MSHLMPSSLWTRLSRMPRVSSWLKWPLVPLAALAFFGVVISQTTGSPAPWVDLASAPLYARGVKAKPTLTLALSVEFPTVGAQYRGANDYSPDTQFVGYFNSDRCYRYDPFAGQFNPIGDATNRTCDGKGFSGNFMNWATSSAIDILRYGLTGGDRVVDASSSTVLQRAVLPTNFYNNSSNYPAKQISAALAQGAVPSDFLKQTTGSTYQGTVYIANCSNQVYFGTESTGYCGSPGNNGNLGQYGVAVKSISSLPSGTTFCSSENGTCTLPTDGVYTVYYGAKVSNRNQGWNYRVAAGSISCNNSVFGDPLSGTGKSCYYVLTGQSTTSTVGITYSSGFNVRSQVCDSTGTTLNDVRTVNGQTRSFCTLYPSGSYKPTGNLQRYSDKVRVSVFGYLYDNTTSRYGGVLRAPMKYVGPNTYDASFNLTSSNNPAKEWDVTTGIFTQNPDSNTTIANLSGNYISGAINYLNQFGRTGNFGGYKTYDPVNELYYEALRYLQGLAPTAGATSNMTDAMKDGFPVYSSWTDPHPAIQSLGSTGDYSCLKNNILTIGDINTHYDGDVPGSDTGRTYSDASNQPDFTLWKSVIAGFENGNSVTYPDNSGTNRTTGGNPNPTNYNILYSTDDGSKSYRNYLGAMSYWANTHDIRGSNWSASNLRRPGMKVTSYFIDVNEYSGWSGNVSYNQFYYAAKYGGFDASSAANGNPFTSDGSTYSNGLWARDTTSSPRLPKTFFLASDAVTVLNSLDSIFQTITSDTASIAGVAITTSRVASTDGATFFQSTFDPSTWSGDVVPYTVSSGGTITAGSWDVASAFTAAQNASTTYWTTRKIAVGQNSGSSFSAADFNWANLTAAQKTALMTGTASTTIGEMRANFIRGDRSNEGTTGGLRTRSNVLGDIVNSALAYAGAPSTSITDTGYASFYTTNKDRTKAIYVGANDGMLHAFDATNGKELFAYIPSFAVDNLYKLTDSSYVHTSYVDAPPIVSEAQVGSSWKSVLVSGAGAGGQGVFALDVTNPSSFSAANNVLWEFTDADDVDMGNVIGTPGIFKIRTDGNTTTPTYKWYAVVASGVNNYAHGTPSGAPNTNYATDTHYSSSGNPAIFILDLSHQSGTAWTQGTDYYKIVVPQASTTKAMGIANFSGRTASGVLTALYAGDLQGNLWKFAFTGKATSQWNFASLNARADQKPLFIATDAAGATQPITTAPEIGLYGSNAILLFGTGKFIDNSDNSAPYASETFYAVYDASTTKTLTRSYLQAITGSGTSIGSTSTFAWGIPTQGSDLSARAGWYYDLPSSNNTGERIISTAVLANWKVYVNSIEPSSGGCSSGTSTSYTFQLATGTGSGVENSTGMLGAPLVLYLGGGTRGVTSGGSVYTSQPAAILEPSTAGTNITSAGNASTTIGVLNWREVFAYPDLRSKATSGGY